MQKVLLFSNDKAESLALKEEFTRKIVGKDIKIVSAQDQPDYIVSIGGDGTLLSAFHKFQDLIDYSQFIGIHTGHLGFYTDWLSNGLDELIDVLVKCQAQSVTYPLLSIKIELKDQEPQHLLALNEFALRAKEGTAVLDVFLHGFHFEIFRGDGICISTPTGSTALNKSLGGAVIHPKVEAMQLTEIASINNLVYRTLSSPIIVAKDETICLKPLEDKSAYKISVDNQNFNYDQISKIQVKIADQRISFSSYRHTHFWDRVESAFIGGNVDLGKERRRL